MTYDTEETETAPAAAASEQPKGTKKASVAKRARQRCAEEGQVGQEGHPGQESAQGREESHRRPGRQQDRDDPGTAEAARRGHRQGTAQSDGLAAAFPARLPISGTLGKKMGLTVVSTKGEDGERSYSVKA